LGGLETTIFAIGKC